MKAVLILSAAILFPFLCKTQNLLINGDFEKGKSPQCAGDATNDFLDNWHSHSHVSNDDSLTAGIFWDKAMHSPDLFEEGILFTSTCSNTKLNSPGFGYPNGGAQSGNRCIGMSPYELVTTDLTGLVVGKIYNVSMYIQMADDAFGLHSDTELKVYISRDKIDYKSQGDNCYNDCCRPVYVDHEDGVLQEIEDFSKSFTLDPALYYSSASKWTRVSFSFRWEEEYEAGLDDMKWLTLEVREKNYTDPLISSFDCFEDYLFIDNVVVQEAAFCTSPCAPVLGELEYSYLSSYSAHNTFANALVSNANPWVFYVKNAIGIDFNLIDTDGHIIYNQRAFNPNGLVDVGYTDYQFFWNGDVPFTSNDDYPNFGGDFGSSTLLPDDVYAYNIKIWNCDPGDLVDHDASLHYICCLGNNLMVADMETYDLIDCCIPNATFDNITWTSDFRQDVSDFITAGVGGPTIVASGAHVEFFADNNITLGPGFLVDPGGDFDAVLQNCLYSPRSATYKPRENLEGIRNTDITDQAVLLRTTFNPMNVQNNFIFGAKGYSAESVFDLTFFSVDGKIMLNNSQVTQGTIFDLNTFNTGVYIVRVNDGKNNETHKIVVLH